MLTFFHNKNKNNPMYVYCFITLHYNNMCNTNIFCKINSFGLKAPLKCIMEKVMILFAQKNNKNFTFFGSFVFTSV